MKETIVSYRPNDLRKINRQDALKLVNERIQELRDANMTLANFKCEKLNMSNSSAHKIMTEEFGFIKPKSEYFYREKTEAEKATTPKDNTTKSFLINKHDILDSIRNTEKVEKKSTSFMICVDTREEWNSFCKQYYMLDKTLLLDAALRMFLTRFKN